MREILGEVPSLRDLYIPTPWAYHFHLQSVYNIANSRTDKIEF